MLTTSRETRAEHGVCEYGVKSAHFSFLRPSRQPLVMSNRQNHGAPAVLFFASQKRARKRKLMRVKQFEQFPSDEALYDLTADGSVNFADLSVMKQLFFAPPEPSGTSDNCSQ